MKLSVLVISHNVRDLLGRCLESVVGQAATGIETEVVVADNASVDGSGDLVRELYPESRLLASETNLGFSRAVNRAAGVATGELVLILNPDVELPEGSLGKMVGIMDRGPEITAIGVRQVDSDGFFQLACGLRPTLPAELGRRLVQRGLDRKSRRTARLVDRWLSQSRPIPWVAASCLMVRRRAFEEIGGFDEEFFLFFEDIDFCLRLAEAGGRVFYEPEVTVVHHRGASAAGDPGFAERAYRQSQIRFWSKHRPRWEQLLLNAYLRSKGQAPQSS